MASLLNRAPEFVENEAQRLAVNCDNKSLDSGCSGEREDDVRVNALVKHEEKNEQSVSFSDEHHEKHRITMASLLNNESQCEAMSEENRSQPSQLSSCSKETQRQGTETREDPKTGKRKRAPPTPWQEKEHANFLIGLEMYGRGEWRSISRYLVPTRTPVQIASHAQKFFLRMQNKGELELRRGEAGGRNQDQPLNAPPYPAMAHGGPQEPPSFPEVQTGPHPKYLFSHDRTSPFDPLPDSEWNQQSSLPFGLPPQGDAERQFERYSRPFNRAAQSLHEVSWQQQADFDTRYNTPFDPRPSPFDPRSTHRPNLYPESGPQDDGLASRGYPRETMDYWCAPQGPDWPIELPMNHGYPPYREYEHGYHSQETGLLPDPRGYQNQMDSGPLGPSYRQPMPSADWSAPQTAAWSAPQTAEYPGWLSRFSKRRNTFQTSEHDPRW